MTDITARLIAQDPTLQRHNEGLWHQDFDSDNPGFSSFNDAGIEIETGEFLYAMTRLLKPDHILETGTHWGIGSSYMGQALKDNYKGHLDTLEFLPEIRARAMARFEALDLNNYVTCHFGDAGAFTPGQDVMYRLILLDTEPQTRFAELIRYFDYLEQGGFVFIHDLHRHMHQIPNSEHGFAWPYGPLPKHIIRMVNDGKLRPFHFSTPRGLTGFYKPSEDDYKWQD